MGLIKISIIILDESLVNKIAAGEVIERPASIVKELIENSLDAGATKIFIEITEAGKSKIKITDNGHGMSKEDVLLSYKQHATSKIKSIKDLFSIRTLGFRGEALSSIASVSETFISSKREEDLSGLKVLVVGGNLVEKKELGMPTGTVIEVNNLFFNTPARKKYLKNDDLELSHMTEIVTKYALINPQVHFKLSHENRLLLETLGNNDWDSTIMSLYGNESYKNLIHVDYKENGFRIKGFISKPSLTKPTKNEQSIYVNKRYIKKNQVISDAINNAYHTMVMVNRYPVAIMDIETSVEETDVNVHPQKAEIRVNNENALYEAVFNAVKSKLSNVDLIASIQDIKLSDFVSDKNYFVPDSQGLLVKEERIAESKILNELKVLGIMNKTYIVGEMSGAMVLIDQHAAAERILYERFTDELKAEAVKTQKLLISELVHLSPKLFQTAKTFRPLLLELGYDTEDFGVSTIMVNTIPVVLGRQFNKTSFLDIIDDLDKNGEPRSLEEFFHKRFARMACRTAIKAGDEITMPQIKKYVQDLGDLNVPYTCPHGRPIIVKISFYEVEKMFKRVV